MALNICRWLGQEVGIYFTSTCDQINGGFHQMKTLFLSACLVVCPQWGTFSSNYISTACDGRWLICGGSDHSFYPYKYICYCLGSEDNMCCLGIIERHHSIYSTWVCPEHYQRPKLPKSTIIKLSQEHCRNQNNHLVSE